MIENIKKNNVLYYARILPDTDIYEVCELTIRTITTDYFVGIDKYDKHAYLFGLSSIGKEVFCDRKDALYKVTEAEENKPKVNKELSEIYYEEY